MNVNLGRMKRLSQLTEFALLAQFIREGEVLGFSVLELFIWTQKNYNTDFREKLFNSVKEKKVTLQLFKYITVENLKYCGI
jgi:hypothetical protein